MKFTDCTLNLKYDNTPTQHKADVSKAVKAGAHIIGMQEAQTPEVIAALVGWVRENPAWSLHHGGECPILYRSDMFTPLKDVLHTATKGQPGVNPPRVIHEILFRLPDGTLLTYLNHHAEQQFALKYAFTANYRIRRARARACFRMLRVVAHSAKTPFVRVGGDFNISLIDRAANWYPYTLRRMFTFDRLRGLDHIGYSGGVRLSNKRRVVGFTDHRIVLVDVEL